MSVKNFYFTDNSVLSVGTFESNNSSASIYIEKGYGDTQYQKMYQNYIPMQGQYGTWLHKFFDVQNCSIGDKKTLKNNGNYFEIIGKNNYTGEDGQNYILSATIMPHFASGEYTGVNFTVFDAEEFIKHANNLGNIKVSSLFLIKNIDGYGIINGEYALSYAQNNWQYPTDGIPMTGNWVFKHTLHPPFDNTNENYFSWDIFLGTAEEIQYTFPGEEANTGGATGNFDDSSTIVDFPEVPTVSAITSNMISMFAPSISELSSLSDYLWTPTFYEAITKLFQSPMEAIIGLSAVNVNPTTSGSEEIKVGRVATGISANKVSTQYVALDCGSLSLKEYWGSSLDYSPFTKVEIYLPFIGIKPLNTDDVMGSTISVKYYIDLLTGSCVCFLKISNSKVQSILYNYSGQIASQIPLSSTNLNQMITGLIGAASSAALGIASGGASAIAQVATGTALNVLNSKMHVERGGSLGSNVGAMGIKYPYLIITRPVQSLPANYNNYCGYPSNITAKLSTLSGYTEVENVILSGFTNATENEKNEIISLLESGVIL